MKNWGRSGVVAAPEGYITIRELSELSEFCTNNVRYRLKRAGVEGKKIKRVNVDGVNLGFRDVWVFPRNEALYAVLK